MDSTYVEIVTPIVSTLLDHVSVQGGIVGLIVMAIAYIAGVLKLSKKNIVSTLKVVRILVEALLSSTEKEIKGTITDNVGLANYAAAVFDKKAKEDKGVLAIVKKSFKSSLELVNTAYPILKPLLKSDVVINMFKRGR